MNMFAIEHTDTCAFEIENAEYERLQEVGISMMPSYCAGVQKHDKLEVWNCLMIGTWEFSRGHQRDQQGQKRPTFREPSRSHTRHAASYKVVGGVSPKD